MPPEFQARSVFISVKLSPMRCLYSCLLLLLALPALAQQQARQYSLEDSTEVLLLLEQAEAQLASEKTFLISAQYYGDAYRLSQLIGFYKGAGWALRGLARLTVRQKPKYSMEAMQYFEWAMDIWKATDDRYELAYTYWVMGDAFAERWYLQEEALGYYQQALTLTRQLRKDSETYQILLKMLRVCLALGKMERAETYSKPLFAYYRRQGLHHALADAKMQIAEKWAQLERLDKARALSLEAQNGFVESGGSPKEFTSYLEAIRQHQPRTNRVEPWQWITFAVTLLVLVGLSVWSYFYARAQVRKMES